MYKIYTRNSGITQRLYHKLWLVMRLTTIILIASLMQVSASTLAQKITLNRQNARLETVLQDIRKQSGYDIYYDSKDIAPDQKVSVKVTNANVQEALTSTFKNLPLTFDIDGKIISIKKKQPTFLDNLKVVFAAIDVHGRVVDEAGKPLPGVTVRVKNSSAATITDENGQFTLKKIDDNTIIQLSFIGYVSKELNAKDDLTFIMLQISTSKLDEVQVQAYGVTSQRLSTGNISSVKAADIEKQPIVNPLLALQASVPGLFIQQTSGRAGGGVNPLIQGKNSINSGNDPLIIVDNIPYISELLPGLRNDLLGSSGNNGGGQGSPLNFLSPQDIESISVLKDADATSIYGSRGANGVILITTKKGKAGHTKVDINVQNGIGKQDARLKLLNTQQYLDVRKQALKNDDIDLNIPPYNQDYYKYFAFPDVAFWDQTRYTDWQKVLLGGTARNNDYRASISGGSLNTQFLVSSAYHYETTVFPGDDHDKKGSFHFNLNHASENQKFKFNITANYQADANNLSNIDYTPLAVTLPPNAPALYNGDGSLNWQLSPTGASTWNNPLANKNARYNIFTYNLTSSSGLSYQLAPGLIVKCNLGYDDLQSNETAILPLTALAPETRSTAQRFAQLGNNNIKAWSIEPQINYSFPLLNGTTDILLGSSLQNRSSNGFLQNSFGYSSDALLNNPGAATTFSPPSVTSSIYRYNAFFGRFNYNYDNKYIIDLTARRDGSSRFGAENRFHNFGSFGAAWLFSNESFFKPITSFLSFGKLRASYGTTGNDQIGDYQFLSVYLPISTGVPYQNVASISANTLANPYLQWETTNKLQIGLDLGLLKDKIIFNTTYYRNRSSNQLLNYSLPWTTGFGGIMTNFPAIVQNSGWEISVNTENVNGQKWKWKSNFNITIPKNEVLSFPNLSTSSYADRLVVGQPLDIIKTYKSVGVDPATGLYTFVGTGGVATSDPGFDLTNQTQLINTAPKFYGGFNNAISYKAFALDFTFQFVKQVAAGYYYGNYPGSYGNQPTSVLNAWKNAGDISRIQQVTTGFGGNATLPSIYQSFSDAIFEDASYIRLKNVSFSWTIPTSFTQKLKIEGCRLYAHAQNLLTFTRYSGLDPETPGKNMLPPLKVMTIGIQVTL